MFLVLAVLCINAVSSEEYLEVDTNQGSVRGYKTPEGVYAFYGIPYATAPTGANKFKAPLPPPSWTTTYDAVERNIACPQGGSMLNSDTIIKEDCLITNIFVPDTDKYNLPVVVYFHGGAYQFGNGEMMSPKQLVRSKKIIALNFNYRLGAHGFLCLGTKDAPGNAAMKDQVALLRWVQNNIEFFGGNPRDVTISGCSAGGSSVDLHLVSKMSAGLFNKAIPESSSNLAAHSVQPDPVAYAKRYAKLLNFSNVENIEALEEFYKKTPLSLLTSFTEVVMENLDCSVIFTPCIESDIGEEMFLDDDPVNIIKTGAYQKLPMLYGFTNLEGLVRFSFFNKWKDLMNENFSNFLPENLEFKSKKEKRKVAQLIKEFYFGNNTIDENTALNYVYYLSDIIFIYAILRSFKLQSESGNENIYLYEYTYDKSGNSLPYNMHGASHCHQSDAVMDEANESELSEEYKQVKARMRHLWLNFITTGKPVPKGSLYPEWPPAALNSSTHMVLSGSLTLKGRLYPQLAKFWEKIYGKYYRRPKPPTY